MKTISLKRIINTVRAVVVLAAGIFVFAACALTAVADESLTFSLNRDRATIVVPEGAAASPARLVLAWGEGESVVVADLVSVAGGTFDADLSALGVPVGATVRAELVAACDVLDCVKGMGSQYIDLGLTCDVGTRITMTAKYTNAGGTQTAWGFTSGGGCWFGKNGVNNYQYGGTSFASAMDKKTTAVDFYAASNVKVTVEGAETDVFYGRNPGSATLTVFATLEGAGMKYFSYMDLYGFTVEQGGEVRVDLVPVKKDGIAQLYDRASDTFCQDFSGNGFGAGEVTTASGSAIARSAAVEFQGGSSVSAKVEGVTVDRDGASYVAELQVFYPATGYEAKWAWHDDLTAFTHDAPESFTDVGVYTNAVRVTAADLEPFVGQAVVTINRFYQYHLETSGVLAPIPDQTFVAGGTHPALEVTCGGVTLEEGVHYAVAWENADRPGFARAVVTGIGDACGEISAEFFISDPVATGLRISVLGDSYSTYNGVGVMNAPFYPQNGVDVTSVGLTYWMRLVGLLGGSLEIANGWGGSCVSTAGGTDSAFVSRTRFGTLGTPDVIVVMGSANDVGKSNRAVQLDCYDPDVQKGNLDCFRPAYAYLLRELKACYPDAEIVCLFPAADETDEINSETWLQNAPVYMDDMAEIAAHYGVTGVKLHGMCRVYSNHPNAQGMLNIARQAYSAYVASHRTASGAIECALDADGLVACSVPCGLVAGKTADLVVVWDGADRGADASAWAHQAKVGEVTAVGGRIAGIDLKALGVGGRQCVRVMAVDGETTLSASEGLRTGASWRGLSLKIVGHEAQVTVPGESVTAPSVLKLSWNGASAVIAEADALTSSGGTFTADLSELGVPDGAAVTASLVAAYGVADYIEGTGSQYVSTGIPYADNTCVTMTAQFTGASSTSQTAWGFSSGGGCWFGCSANGTDYSFGGVVNPVADAVGAMRTTSVKYLNPPRCTIDGVVRGSGQSRPSSTAPLTVFATPNGNSMGFFSKMKLAALTVEQNDAVSADLKPIVCEDGVGALWDAVTGTVYPSEGADPFLVGSCVRVAKGVTLDSSSAATYRPSAVQAVVTGMNAKYDGEPHAAAVQVVYPNAAECTVKWAWSDDPAAFTHDEPEAFAEIGVYTTAVRVTCPGYDPFEREIEVRVLEGTASRTLKLTRPSNRRLAVEWGPSVSQDGVYLVWGNADYGAEALDAWPNKRLLTTLDADSEPGKLIVDKPEGAAFTRLIAVSAGVDPALGVDGLYESLTHTGTEVIDLGYVPTSKTGVEIDMAMEHLDEGNENVPFFGTGNGSRNDLGNVVGELWMLWYYGSNGAGTGKRKFENWCTGNWNGKVFLANESEMTTRQTLVVDPVGKKVAYGSISDSIGGAVPTDNLEYPLAVFGINSKDGFQVWDTSNKYGILKVYEVRIYENGSLVRQFVPAAKDGKALMVDLLDPSNLAVNKGSGNFVLGDEVVSSEVNAASDAVDLTKPVNGLMVMFR